MSDNWTQAHMAQAIEWHRLVDEDMDAEADPIYARLRSELGAESCSELLQFIEDRREQATAPAPAPTAKPKIYKFSRPRRVSQAAETWRCLGNYPLYEISSHGRVRCVERARPDDFLKPRWRWRYGMGVPFVVLKDRDGRRSERMIPKLLIAAGFMPKPEWMEKKAKTASVA